MGIGWKDERGIALVMTLGVMLVLSLMGSSIVLYSQSNESAAKRSSTKQSARSLAAAGLESAVSVLSNPVNASLLATPSLLPASKPATPQLTTPEGGQIWYWGTVTAPVFVGQKGLWRLNAAATLPTPNGGTSALLATASEDVQFFPLAAQLSSTEAWKYIYAAATGAVYPSCDMTIYNNTNINASFYVAGSLCMQTPSSILGPSSMSSPSVTLNVKGFLSLKSNTNIGTNPVRLTGVHIGGGCYPKTGPWTATCGPTEKVFPTSDAVVPTISKPVADFNNWYLYSSPGPVNPCTTSTGTPPIWDVNAVRNNDAGLVDLTPSSAYSCATAYGSISWTPGSPGKLKVDGTMYVDGSLTSTASVVDYDGKGVIYISGTMLLKNASLCAVVNAAKNGCDNPTWTAASDPDILLIAADGTGGQVPVGDSIEVKSGNWQGALYGSATIEVDTSSSAQGPMVAETEIISQTGGSPFPQFLNVPFGTPGNAVIQYRTLRPVNYIE